MRVLITGGAGFIGSHIAELLAGQCEIRVLDNLDTGSVSNLDGIQVQFIHASILDREAVRRAVAGVDYIFHLAAKTSVAESMQQAVAYNEVNTVGTLVVLEEAAQAGVRKLVFSSSAAVYGDNPVSPKHEALASEPKSPYAITKLDGEYYCQMFAATQRLPTICLRYFNVFGPRQNPRSDYAGVIPLFATKALNHQPICIHGDGLQTRDFVYVRDVAAANVQFARLPGEFGIFNIASRPGHQHQRSGRGNLSGHRFQGRPPAWPRAPGRHQTFPGLGRQGPRRRFPSRLRSVHPACRPQLSFIGNWKRRKTTDYGPLTTDH